ncbi:MAG: 30S ribosomal protein S8 [Ignavibacteriales bacterium]|nr:30S ribosomal protein S8 [Ignavibacteriales bacterium]OGU63314.1 MAG: 30S ribosomal protein S8 [Stygiobacter sp. GWC2_38_9]OGU82130.1 MAG: 30S ribosomal protein S8 [Stygiobacter sp. RIFOXYA12_FULL_38_9]OGV08873.1 MAG: 30S ribosomal protein S8 [Stygiobacter sp. RIFOXYB2_FULL_37_11]OGV15538.1 MAG: 30S ribosomal protein S8 [Stygiobacter sp. RIFOXYC2_FULL_38_25]OGV16494.1 MAG: 30S ribosomal protein S8 [Stygiobacter sp. RIFOXYA2_FULL_38_8]OGV25474.1 MAG: 30S ribosomal protein S8 [Stygiobacter s
MPATDPIADFLTRVRNAVKARKKYVEIPSSKMKIGLAEILKTQKFIKDYNVIEDNKQNVLRVHLQYVNGVPSITGLKRISTPGLRTYVGSDEIPRVLGGLGISILSTPSGLKTDKQAKKESVGGELVCQVW